MSAQIYEAKYLRGQSILDPSLHSRHDCSSTWKSVLYGTELLTKGMSWRIGKGDTTHFWKDHWICDETLMQHSGVLDIRDLDCTISKKKIS